MTRLELAKEIYRLNVELGIIKGNGEKSFVKGILEGVGYARPMRKAELEARLDGLRKRVA